METQAAMSLWLGIGGGCMARGAEVDVGVVL